MDIAEAIIKVAPERPFGWIHRSFALHEVKRTQEAWDKLLPAALKFPKVWIFSYNLACYACQLGNLEDARQWLVKAFEIGGTSKIKLQALDDPDLEPLWQEIGYI